MYCLLFIYFIRNTGIRNIYLFYNKAKSKRLMQSLNRYNNMKVISKQEDNWSEIFNSDKYVFDNQYAH